MRRVFILWAGVAVIVLLAAYGVNRWTASVSLGPSAQAETVLARVQRTKTLTCAYYLWPELIERNPNTGVMSGAFVDIIDAVAKNLGAHVKWQEEATIDNFIALLNADRVDAICVPFSPPPFMRGTVHFARPILYTSFDIYARPGDTRFDSGRETVDRPDIRLLSLDGSASGYYAGRFFPHAHANSLPATLGAGQVLLDLKDGKADVTVADQMTAARFLDTNPDSLKHVRWNGKPLLTLGLTPFITRRDDLVWAGTLDAILGDLLDDGEIAQILADHHLLAGTHYSPIARAYGE